MTRETPSSGGQPASDKPSTYYTLLALHPSASVQQIRRAYRELSKLYHPDTTNLPAEVATAKFQELNEAYATLSSPERRFAYDLKIGYSRVSVIQPPADLNRPVSEGRRYRSSAYLDPTDRPLSAGEIFALFILGLTFAVCLVLVVAIGLTRGETVLMTDRAAPPIETVDLAPNPTPALSPMTQPVTEQPTMPTIEPPANEPPANEPQTPMQQTTGEPEEPTVQSFSPAQPSVIPLTQPLPDRSRDGATAEHSSLESLPASVDSP